MEEDIHNEKRTYNYNFLPEVPSDIRVVVGIDFGTTFSGFTCASINSREVITNQSWPGVNGQFKTNTVLQYDENYEGVVDWGARALVSEIRRRESKIENLPRPIELFKLHLANVTEDQKPKLPFGLTPERVITDYFRKMGELIKETVEKHWPGTNFFRMVRLVVTIPADFIEETKAFMRHCIYKANLISNSGTQNLQFTTEPEAAAVHCIKILNDHELKVGSTYLIVDCGGGTIDLTARKLLPNNQLSENTERSGGFCGSTYVDRNFVEYLKSKVGEHAISMLRDKHYRQFHSMIQQFCERAKIPFTDNISEFRTFEFDIEKYCPALKLYIKDPVKDELEQDEWTIDIEYETIKSFFDPVVNQIIILMSDQLSKISQCSIIYMVGGFSESRYLQAKIREKFSSYKIATPPHPVAAIVRGAGEYGLDMDTIKTRVLKWTYGVQIYPLFKEGVDPPSRKTSDGHIYKFNMLAKRGVEVSVNQEFTEKFIPFKQKQNNANIKLFYSPKHSVEYCDEDEVKLLYEFDIDLPDTHLGQDRLVSVNLCFGKMEMIATVKNEANGNIYRYTSKLEF